MVTEWPLDHVGIAVTSIEEARPLYERLTGAPGGPTLELPEQGVNVAFFGRIELLEPRGPESSLTRFFASRGPGLHHMAFRVTDIAAELARLEAVGVRLVDREARIGAAGHPIAFLHPSAAGGVLVELVEVPVEPIPHFGVSSG
jgi:methylmalonyl-CoA epimerase